MTLLLRKGETPWTHDKVSESISPENIKGPLETEILIVGAGISGAFLAEAFTRAGKRVVIVDRHRPQTASTMASTSLLQWEIDAPLIELTGRIGFEKAAQVYRQSFSSVDYITNLITKLNIACQFSSRHALYLEGDRLGIASLREEYDLRRKIGLPCEWLEPEAVAKGYGFMPRAAIRSGSNAEADPVLLARGLLLTAMARGATVISPANARAFDFEGRKTYVRIEETGLEIIASKLLLATGYEMPDFVRCDHHHIVSTWAICTAPQRENLPWHEHDLVWEASDPYFYMRTTERNEIIIGGEDEAISNSEKRDRLIPEKTFKLQKLLQGFYPRAETEVQYAWSAFFGITEDALPLIGAAPGCKNVWAAYGYGGNGITFSAWAAQLLRDEILSGKPVDEIYALNR